MRLKAYPDWACVPCGKKHGARMRQESPSTFHYGKCDICGENTSVTQPRDYGHFPKWFQMKEGK